MSKITITVKECDDGALQTAVLFDGKEVTHSSTQHRSIKTFCSEIERQIKMEEFSGVTGEYISAHKIPILRANHE